MIVYNPGKNWIGDIFHLFKSYIMKLLFIRTLWVGLYALIVFCVIHFFNLYDSLNMDTTAFSLLGIVLSILMVFRTNTAYDRWWEGRKQWGALVNHSRNLAIYLKAILPETENQSLKFFAVHISNFCLALKEHLRKGVKLEDLIDLTEEEKAEYLSKNHIPNYISLQIYQKITHHYKKGQISDAELLNLKTHSQALLDILGACERIKKTPIPFSYVVYLEIFVIFYGLIVPFALIDIYYWAVVPITMFVFFAFAGIQMIADEIEDPFSLLCNALPTGNIAHTIKKNVFEILINQSSTSQTSEPELYQKIF